MGKQENRVQLTQLNCKHKASENTIQDKLKIKTENFYSSQNFISILNPSKTAISNVTEIVTNFPICLTRRLKTLGDLLHQCRKSLLQRAWLFYLEQKVFGGIERVGII